MTIDSKTVVLNIFFSLLGKGITDCDILNQIPDTQMTYSYLPFLSLK